eukprot:TRINITY_DN13314_c1_g1_i1.p1 TRINITY_DN13314_c1_g1~~TRINITY_DN13314_c1_g1_i1.p1  ORF type:complete len:231 (+),score=-16.94 TRINITY_DN13314_c1_g1_i1:313-1005(+)
MLYLMPYLVKNSKDQNQLVLFAFLIKQNPFLVLLIQQQQQEILLLNTIQGTVQQTISHFIKTTCSPYKLINKTQFASPKITQRQLLFFSPQQVQHCSLLISVCCQKCQNFRVKTQKLSLTQFLYTIQYAKLNISKQLTTNKLNYYQNSQKFNYVITLQTTCATRTNVGTNPCIRKLQVNIKMSRKQIIIKSYIPYKMQNFIICSGLFFPSPFPPPLPHILSIKQFVLFFW